MILTALARAEEPSPQPSHIVHVVTLDPDVDTKALTGNRKTIQIDQSNGTPQSRYAIPSRQKREAIFEQSGVKPFIGSLDELDRDRLYKRARSLPFPKLKQDYPSISEKSLQRLTELVKEDFK